MTTKPKDSRRLLRWSSTQFAYLALALNGMSVAILVSSFLAGNVWWQVAVPVAVGFLLLGAIAGFQTRRLRIRERHQGS